jgi:hypothetical protein
VIARSTLNLSKLVYTIRTVPPKNIKNDLSNFDENWRLFFNNLLGQHLTDTQFEQLHLSLKNNGLGIQTNEQFITKTKLLLNMKFHKMTNKTCGCCGKAKLDTLGIHCLSCNGKGDGMFNRHQAIAKVVKDMCREAEILSVETPNLLREPRNAQATYISQSEKVVNQKLGT